MKREEIIDRFKRLQALAAAYRKSEEALRLDEARLEALQKLNGMDMASGGEVIVYSLEEAVRLTGSRIGWMGALSPDETTLTMHCWSRGTKDACGISDRPHRLDVEDGGIWMEPIRQRKPVIVNDYPHYPKKDVPYGHIPLTRFMGIPVYDGLHIVAVAEVGNKDLDYDHSDLRQLSLLMGGVWRILMRKQAEEALSESKARAELYVDLMGHDIINMNQVAIGFLEMAIEKLGLAGRLEPADLPLLEKPMEAMKNSAKLIDNVKKLQRLRAGTLEPMLLDLGQALLAVKNEAACARERHIRIEYVPARGLYVKADELLKDVFSNIVCNAIRHSDRDKPLRVSIGVEAIGNWYKVGIEDNGPGIPDARKHGLFDRLSRGKMKAFTGLGLGLVKTLVESYHGHIWVEDRIEGDHTQGCRFVVLLPKATCGPADGA